ncbi:MAG: hypothetical protein WCT37_02055 [Patescibacteria group bacterium]|jgi:hypothetical protein
METSAEFIRRKKSAFSKGEDKFVNVKDIGRKGKHYFEKEAITLMPQYNLNNKVFIIERLKRIKIEGDSEHKLLKNGDIEYRICYFIVGKIGKAKNKWWWGQSCPLIPAKDLKKLIQKAENEGTILV